MTPAAEGAGARVEAAKAALANVLHASVTALPARLKSASDRETDPILRQKAATDALSAVCDCLTGLGYPRSVLSPLEGLWTALCDHSAGIKNPLLDVAEYDPNAPRRPHSEGRWKVETTVAITLLRESGLSLKDALDQAVKATGENAKALIAHRKNIHRKRAVSIGEVDSYQLLLSVARNLAGGDKKSLKSIARRLLSGLHLEQ